MGNKLPTPFNIITLCGSTRFKIIFENENKRLTLEGNVVISVGVYGHSGDEDMLECIHFQKIEMANQIHVINVDGHIGNSTKIEIEYAKLLNKKVTYYQ